MSVTAILTLTAEQIKKLIPSETSAGSAIVVGNQGKLILEFAEGELAAFPIAFATDKKITSTEPGTVLHFDEKGNIVSVTAVKTGKVAAPKRSTSSGCLAIKRSEF